MPVELAHVGHAHIDLVERLLRLEQLVVGRSTSALSRTISACAPIRERRDSR